MSKNSRVRVAGRGVASVLVAAALAGGVALAGASSASAAPADCNYMGYNSGPDKLGLQLDSSERAMANAINSYRQANGKAPLTVTSSLARSAMWASLDDARRGFAPGDHVDSRGMGIVARAQYCSGYSGTIGEINYFGSGGANGNYYGSWQAALAWWKQDPPHNALLLSSSYTTFSVAWAYNGVNAEQGFWTVDFGTH